MNDDEFQERMKSLRQAIASATRKNDRESANSVSANKTKDKDAELENIAIQSGDLEEKTDEHFKNLQKHRDESVKDALHSIFLWGLKVVAIALFVVFGIRLAHMVMPKCWFWLSPDQISEIDRILFSGAFGALISKYLGPIIRR